MDHVFLQRLNEVGTQVRLRFDPTQAGECTGKSQDDGDGLIVEVRFAGKRPRFVMAEDLELLAEGPDDLTIVREGRFARARSLRKQLTAVQLGGRLSELIYSLDTTNTDFMPHQFKPLLALLDSPSKGLLVADEVGLGKTIEAGLMWTELRFRTNATRLLVVCPAMLTDKWKLELSRRFGTDARIISAGEFAEWLESGITSPIGSAVICSLQGIRPPSGWDDERDPSPSPSARVARKLASEAELQNMLFDLTVIDEAHYMRNNETSSAELGRLLRPVSDHLVLLSATPINTRSDDLFNLVSLVDPDQFRYPNVFEQVLDGNRPLIQAANRLKRPQVRVQDLKDSLNQIAADSLLKHSAALKQLRVDLDEFPADHLLTPSQRVEINHRLERINLLGQVVVRTRKRDVFENRVERKPARIAATMSAPERELYGLVTDAIKQYALHNRGVEGFLLAMPQRQMASSMYAAAKRWLGPMSDDDELNQLAFEAFDELDGTAASPIVSHVARAVHGRVDLRALRQEDSKFTRLLQLLREHEGPGPHEKVLIFSYFRDTLEYLRERLGELGIAALVVKGGDDKQATIDEFRESQHHRVLLASEVAAEGVDLQFMRVLINYDLPWNPMKVEQRIGRIDRIGQEADAITILNMVYADTIDDRILERLFMRLQLFHDSLGCTEEVLGDNISKLTRDLLSARLTREQEEDRIEYTRAAIEQRRKDMEIVEESEADLMGLGDYVRSRVSQARKSQRRITDEDLLMQINDYLEDNAATGEDGYVLRMEPNQSTAGVLRLPYQLAASLAQFREHHRLVKSKLESGHETAVIIRNHVSAGASSGKHELINQYHPLIRMIASEHAVQGTFPHAVEISAAGHALEILPGNYAFAAESWRFEGTREEEMLGAVFIAVDGSHVIEGDDAFDLLNALRQGGADWIDAVADLPPTDDTMRALDRARIGLIRRFKQEEAAHDAENSDRARFQHETLARSAERRRASLSERVRKAEYLGQKNLIQLTRGQLRKLDEQTKVARARVDGRAKLRARHDPLVDGFVRVLP